MVYNHYQLSPQYNNWIYVQGPETDCVLSNVLVVNPQIIQKAGSAVHIEACGSIDNGETDMMVLLSTYIEATGTVVNLGRFWNWAKKRKFILHAKEAALFEHEMDHLDGISAIQKGNILDFTEVSEEKWSNIDSNYRNETTIPEFLERNQKSKLLNHWLIPRDGRLQYYFVDGRPMKDFPLHSPARAGM